MANTAEDRVIDGDENVDDAVSLTVGAQVIAGPVAPCVLEDIPPSPREVTLKPVDPM